MKYENVSHLVIFTKLSQFPYGHNGMKWVEMATLSGLHKFTF